MCSSFVTVLHTILEAYQLSCREVCRKMNIHQTAFDILMFLANNHEYYTAKDISSFRGIKPNMVSFHVEKLVKNGFLVREPIPGDRRRVKLVCTERATPVIEMGRALQKSFLTEMCRGISEEELENFKKCFEQFEKNANNIKECSEAKQ